jgi:hypothetical protein
MHAMTSTALRWHCGGGPKAALLLVSCHSLHLAAVAHANLTLCTGNRPWLGHIPSRHKRMVPHGLGYVLGWNRFLFIGKLAARQFTLVARFFQTPRNGSASCHQPVIFLFFLL